MTNSDTGKRSKQSDVTPPYLLVPNDFKPTTLRHISHFLRTFFASSIYIFGTGLIVFDTEIFHDWQWVGRFAVFIFIQLPVLLYLKIPSHWRYAPIPSRSLLVWITLIIPLVIAFIWRVNQPESPPSLFLAGWVMLLTLVMISQPMRVFNGLAIGFHQLTQDIRRDKLSSYSSPFTQVQHPWNRFYDYWIPKYLSFENRKGVYFACLVAGGVFIPILLHFLTNISGLPAQNLVDFVGIDDYWILSPMELTIIGIITSGILIVLNFIWYAARNHNRYIVTEFSTIHEKDSNELQAIAVLSRRLLVKELQDIAVLLKQRQVENVNFSREDAKAFFVSSSFDKEFFDQIQHIVSLEIPNAGRLDIGRLSMLSSRLWARIRIGGSVQRRDSGNIEIDVELHYRSRYSVNVSTIIETSPDDVHIDEFVVRPKTREIALKLLIALEQVSGVGHSWQALDYFLRGLEASAKSNWWQAIAHYYRALGTGTDSEQGRFGVIYFHLGAALIFQGLWEQGRMMLLKAEEYGPLIPETQYMLAFDNLYTYWGHLHKAETIFREINIRCKRALELRKDFPEAYHLLGTAYYRRARIVDRDSQPDHSYPSGKTEKGAWVGIPPSPVKYAREYAYAATYFDKAIRLYDRQINQTRKNARKSGAASVDIEALVLQRMTAAHQLADAHRGRRSYPHAERYYFDMQTVIPLNVRNLADILKSYCNAQLWHKAQEFLFQYALRNEVSRWDADISIHAGWLFVAGANNIKNEAHKRDLISRSYEFLDYALYMRPRYLKDWRQTNWLQAFLTTVVPLSEKYTFDTHILQQRFVDPDGTPEPSWILALLRLRMLDLSTVLDDAVSSNLKLSHNEIVFRRIGTELFNSLYVGGDNFYTEYCRIRKEIIESESQKSVYESLSGIDSTIWRIDISKQLHQELWKKLCRCIEFHWALDKRWLTLRGRCVLDFYLQVSLLTARMLGEAGLYELLNEMSESVCKQLEGFISDWQKEYKRSLRQDGRIAHFTVSAYVFRYQRASLLAWNAFAKLQIHNDVVTTHGSDTSNQTENKTKKRAKEELIDEAKKKVEFARKRLVSVHPLVMYVRSQLFAYDGLYAQAIEELKAILDIIVPYDPKKDVGGSVIDKSSLSPTSNDDRKELYFLERVVGQQQFHNIVNPAVIHQQIAHYSVLLGEPERNIKHLAEAARWSPYNDTDLDILIELAKHLNTMERYDDAQSIVDAIRIPRGQLVSHILTSAKRFAPDVMECVITTRRGRHIEALNLTKQVAQKLEVELPDMQNEYLETSNKAVGFLEYMTLKDFCDGKDVENLIQKYRKLFTLVIDLKTITNDDTFSRGLQHLLFDLAKSEVKSKSPAPDGLPKLFARIWQAQIQLDGKKDNSRQSHDHILNQLATLTYYSLNTEVLNAKMVSIQERKEVDANNKLYDLRKHNQSLMYYALQARDTLLHIAELCNSLAYNRVETGMHEENDYAYYDAATALYIIMFLYQVSYTNHEMHTIYGQKLAQFLDTFGWVIYRNTTPNLKHTFDTRQTAISTIEKLHHGIVKASHFLKLGIRYDPTRAIIHYHLAYLHLEMAETLIQRHLYGFEERQQVLQIDHYPPLDELRNILAGNSTLIGHYLERAETALENAKKQDQFGRLHQRLKRLTVWYKNLVITFRRQVVSHASGHALTGTEIRTRIDH